MLYSILFLVGFLMRTLSDRFLIKSMKSNRSFKVRIQVLQFLEPKKGHMTILKAQRGSYYTFQGLDGFILHFSRFKEVHITLFKSKMTSYNIFIRKKVRP